MNGADLRKALSIVWNSDDLISAATGVIIGIEVYTLLRQLHFRNAFRNAWLKVPAATRKAIRDSLLIEEGLS